MRTQRLKIWMLLSLLIYVMGCQALEEAQLRRQERLRQQAAQPSANPRADETGLVGQPAPGFTGQDLEGNAISLSDFKGQVVVVNFWATWCGPCRNEIPHLEALYQRYKSKGVAVIGVNAESDLAAVKQFAAASISYPVVLNSASQFQAYGVQGIPCTYYVDREGFVRYRDVGFGPGGEKHMESRIQELLQ